jgi:predicted dehydrogenase
MMQIQENSMHLNRRDFTRLLAAASAVTVLPSSSPGQAAPEKKIRYCAVGLGRITVGHFMPGTRMSSLGEITALVSGHREKALKIAAEYGIPASSIYSYENYDRIRDNPDIDAVYIGLPNSMHAEYTIRAAQAGKHVLCEKPMANTVEECEAMIAACRKADRRLMIAYRCQLEATTLHAQKLVRSGALGKIEAIESANGFNIAAGEWRLNRKLAGGGPLMDVGIYSLNACRFLTGEEPVAISAYSSVIDHDGRFEEVEENLSWTMKFPSGTVASCTTTYGANMDGFIRLHGSKGSLTLNGFGYQGIHLTAKLNGALKGEPSLQVDDLEKDKDPAQFKVESDYFSKCILSKTTPIPSGEEGLRDMALMRKIYESAARNNNG